MGYPAQLEDRKLSNERGCLQIYITDAPKKTSNWWFVFNGKERPDVGYLDPSLDVDLYIETNLSSLTKVWLGEGSHTSESEANSFQLVG